MTERFRQQHQRPLGDQAADRSAHRHGAGSIALCQRPQRYRFARLEQAGHELAGERPVNPQAQRVAFRSNKRHAGLAETQRFLRIVALGDQTFLARPRHSFLPHAPDVSH